MIYAWRDRNVHIILKWALYLFFQSCATTSSKSEEKSKDNVQNTRFEDFWLFEELDHQNSRSIKNLRSSARVEKSQSHASRSDRNHLLSDDFQVRFCESKKKQTEMMMKIFAKNLNVMIKYCNKNVIKRLKNKTIIQIVAKINTIIDRMKNELRETANVSNTSSMNRILIFQHFRSENIKLFVRKKKNVMFFYQHS
jgi:hypothetical protein